MCPVRQLVHNQFRAERQHIWCVICWVCVCTGGCGFSRRSGQLGCLAFVCGGALCLSGFQQERCRYEADSVDVIWSEESEVLENWPP